MFRAIIFCSALMLPAVAHAQEAPQPKQFHSQLMANLYVDGNSGYSARGAAATDTVEVANPCNGTANIISQRCVMFSKTDFPNEYVPGPEKQSDGSWVCPSRPLTADESAIPRYYGLIFVCHNPPPPPSP